MKLSCIKSITRRGTCYFFWKRIVASIFLKIFLKWQKCTWGSKAGNFHFTSKCQKYCIKGSASKTALHVLNKQKRLTFKKIISSKFNLAQGIEDKWETFFVWMIKNQIFAEFISKFCEVLTESDTKKTCKKSFYILHKDFYLIMSNRKILWTFLSGSAEIFMMYKKKRKKNPFQIISLINEETFWQKNLNQVYKIFF